MWPWISGSSISDSTKPQILMIYKTIWKHIFLFKLSKMLLHQQQAFHYSILTPIFSPELVPNHIKQRKASVQSLFIFRIVWEQKIWFKVTYAKNLANHKSCMDTSSNYKLESIVCYSHIPFHTQLLFLDLLSSPSYFYKQQ